MSAWQPIETAPRDGSRIQLWVPAGTGHPGQPTYGKWQDQRHNKKPNPYFTVELYEMVGISFQRSYQPTHWKPEPLAPSAGEKA